MSKSFVSKFVVLITALAFSACSSRVDHQSALENLISKVKKSSAPDKRVEIFDIKANYQDEKILLTGETTTKKGLAKLLDLIDGSWHVSVINEVNILPDQLLGDSIYAVINNSVGNIRSKPKHSAELATQAMLGTPLRILKRSKNREWYLVQTPDKYISWIDHGAISIMTSKGLLHWKNSQKIVFTALTGQSYLSPQRKNAVSDLVYGCIIKYKSQNKNYYEVEYPDGRMAYINKQESTSYASWTQKGSIKEILKVANGLMGLPYLWGGTSTKALDCSGFTKTAYLAAGLIIPRDASQQVHEGITVDEEGDFSKLKPGDLLFFGTPKTDQKKERVVHVGLWTEESHMIHASGNVHISSFDQDNPNYDAFNHNRYLRTKRFLGFEKDFVNLINLKNKSLY